MKNNDIQSNQISNTTTPPPQKKNHKKTKTKTKTKTNKNKNKKAQTTTTFKLIENSRNKRRSNRFQFSPQSRLRVGVYCYRFLPLALHESGTRKVYILVSDRV
jgi:hypothetical protein